MKDAVVGVFDTDMAVLSLVMLMSGVEEVLDVVQNSSGIDLFYLAGFLVSGDVSI